MLSHFGGLSCHRSRIAKESFRNGCILCAPSRLPSPGFSVSASLFRMDHIRMNRTFGNRQVNACHIWRKRYNPNGELSDEHSYFYYIFIFYSCIKDIICAITSTVQPLPSILYRCVSLHSHLYQSRIVCNREHSVGVNLRMPQLFPSIIKLSF